MEIVVVNSDDFVEEEVMNLGWRDAFPHGQAEHRLGCASQKTKIFVPLWRLRVLAQEVRQQVPKFFGRFHETLRHRRDVLQ